MWAGAHAVELGSAPGPVVVCGESAGGNLAAVTCLRLKSDRRVAIRYQVLLQPVVDFTLSFPSIAMSPTECLVPRDDLAWYYRTYCGNRCDPKDPSVSPIFAADLSDLPPALIITAEFDTLRDEGEAYAKRLQTAGVRDALHVLPGYGARVPSDARTRSGGADGDRGNRPIHVAPHDGYGVGA